MTRAREHAVLFIAFFNSHIVRRSLDALVYREAPLPYDVFVLENPSIHSDEIRAYLEPLVDQGLVAGHFISSENIAANVVMRAVHERHIPTHYKYISLTEGDVVLDHGAYEEAIAILEAHPDFQMCSIDIHLSNLPLRTFPDAGTWVPTPVDRGDHLEGATGLQFIVFRTDYLLSFVSVIARKQLHEPIALLLRPTTTLSDRNLIRFCRDNGVPWVRTKYRKLWHIGWELYEDLDSEYYRYKCGLIASGQLWHDAGRAVLTRLDHNVAPAVHARAGDQGRQSGERGMRVGITIATYQRPDDSTPAKLRRRLQSVVSQSHGDWVVFLIGDHYEPGAEFADLAGQLSADKCVAVNLPLAAEREALKLVGRALWCCGGTHAMNEALRLQRARGIRYTAHLDDDDYWEPSHLERLMRVYETMPDSAFVYTQAVHRGRRLPAVACDYPQAPNNLPPRAFNLAHSSASWDLTRIPFGYTNCVAELSQVFPTDAYMWTRIASHCSAHDLPTVFVPVVTVIHTAEGSCLE